MTKDIEKQELGSNKKIKDYNESRGENSVFDEIEDQQIFRNEKLLHVGHVPERKRIVGRDKEMKEIARQLYPIIKNQPPTNCLIYGKTGTGKSLVSRHVAKEAKQKAKSENYKVETIYVDCSEHNTHTRATRYIANQLNQEDIEIPMSGIGSSEYYTYIWELLDKKYNSTIIILDEIDKLNGDDILMQFSRAKEAKKTETNLGIIAISNKIRYKEGLSERVKSSFDERDFVFNPYDAKELEKILEHRKDAFYNGVLENEVIPLVSALSAREHGDARKAIEILRNAGKIAEEKGQNKITEKHVYQAQDRAEKHRFNELIKGSTQHVKSILYTLARMTEELDQDSFSTGDIYKNYKKMCIEDLDRDPLSENRVYQLLKEQAFLGVLESKKTSGGRGKGMYLTHRLLVDWEIVKKVLKPEFEHTKTLQKL